MTCTLSVVVSCGSLINNVPGNRGTASCGSAHFAGNACSAPCATGYSGVPRNYTCSLDGTWQSTASVADCVDVNECNNQTICPQVCQNTIGGYRCSCQPGFVLQADNSCIQTFFDPATYSYSFGNYTNRYVVPAGATTVDIAVYGSGGASASPSVGGYPGGPGALVLARFGVTAGQVLTVTVGGPGTGYRQPANSTITGGYVHPSGGGLVGVFAGVILPENAMIIAGSGGGGGTNQGRAGGAGGNLISGMSAVFNTFYDMTQCVGRGGNATAGGLGGGIPGAGVFGSQGLELVGGQAGSYGSGGGAGYFGGGGGGHCPNRKSITPAALLLLLLFLPPQLGE